MTQQLQQLHHNRLLSDAMVLLTVATPHAAIIGDHDELLGVVGDTEIRRSLAAGAAPNTPLQSVLTREFLLVTDTEDAKASESVFLAGADRYMVNVDGRGIAVSVRARHEVADPGAAPTHAVIMVGGEGARLKPLTDSIPKPMLPIGGVPILERIVNHVTRHGVKRITMALGYLGDQIERHFGDGSTFAAAIDYVHETKPLGTAGALGMVKRDSSRPLLVMNGDILTNLDLTAMARDHQMEGAALTVASRAFQQDIPYGVFTMMDGRVVAVEEKPTRTSWTNAGIYIMEPSVLELIPPNQYTDMTLTLEKLISRGDPVRAFCVRESWWDIGRPDDYERANASWQ